MKTKNLLGLVMVMVLLCIVIIPSSYSWYSHNTSDDGKSIHYEDSLDISVKTASMEMSTYKCDKNGNVTNTDLVSTVSVYPNSVEYYKTTLKNNGSDDVMADLETTGLPNNADFAIGTVSPTLNEKAFASRAARSKTADNKVRVYFKTNNSMSAYWSQANNNLTLLNEKGTYQIGENGELTDTQYNNDNNKAGSSVQSGNGGTRNDTNISFTVGGKEYQAKLEKCSLNDNENLGGTDTNFVFYYDLPSNTDSFFFFNHWYLRSGTNREWNRTLDITDLSAGKLYYMTGSDIDGKWKEYKACDVDHTLVAVFNYYKSARLSLGGSVYADIGLKKESETDDEEFVPDYFGNSVTYSVKSGSPTNIVSVNRDGLLTPLANYGNTIIQTTITGKFGDYRVLETEVNIPSNIDQVPIIQNVRVKAGESVDVYWYARNNSSSSNMATTAIILTL